MEKGHDGATWGRNRGRTRGKPDLSGGGGSPPAGGRRQVPNEGGQRWLRGEPFSSDMTPPGVRSRRGFAGLPFRLDLAEARQAVSAFVRRTPLLRVKELDSAALGPVYLKLESLQVTGSFKIRGAANRLLSLSAEERTRGVVACSSGNHGKAVAHVAALLGIPATVFVPCWVDPAKKSAMEMAGARVVLAGDSYDEAESEALAWASSRGMTFIQPFDDLSVVAGQGTLGLELLDEVPDLSRVLVPLSGGGLAGGIAYALKEMRPEIEVVCVSAERARAMVRSLEADGPVEIPEEETIAEALSGGIGRENRYTLALIRELVDRHWSVSEEAIAMAMAYAFSELRLVVEGGGAVALAAILPEAGRGEPKGGPTVVVVSGGNVSLGRWAEVLHKHVGPNAANGNPVGHSLYGPRLSRLR